MISPANKFSQAVCCWDGVQLFCLACSLFILWLHKLPTSKPYIRPDHSALPLHSRSDQACVLQAQANAGNSVDTVPSSLLRSWSVTSEASATSAENKCMGLNFSPVDRCGFQEDSTRISSWPVSPSKITTKQKKRKRRKLRTDGNWGHGLTLAGPTLVLNHL